MITVVVGAQYGSEGKGAIVGHIAGGYPVHVRVGAANAGHTVWVDNEKHVVQQLPCAAYANPFAQLVLGAGAMISPKILCDEINANVAWRQRKMLPPLKVYIDFRAHVVTSRHIEEEQRSGLAERIGSTSTVAREGIGAAQAARVMRTHYSLAKDTLWFQDTPFYHYIEFVDTIGLLHDAQNFKTPILLEGTQGTGLCNVTSPNYPYVTSRNVTASGIAADCGFGPRDIDEVVIVARTYPIRVAGNSGPFWYGSTETDWETLGIDKDREKTTVTKKVRRVATFSVDQIQHAVRVNSATEIALTFADYMAPELYGRSGAITAEIFAQYDRVGPLVDTIEKMTALHVCMIGTGPDSVLDREPRSK